MLALFERIGTKPNDGYFFSIKNNPFVFNEILLNCPEPALIDLDVISSFSKLYNDAVKWEPFWELVICWLGCCDGCESGLLIVFKLESGMNLNFKSK